MDSLKLSSPRRRGAHSTESIYQLQWSSLIQPDYFVLPFPHPNDVMPFPWLETVEPVFMLFSSASNHMKDVSRQLASKCDLLEDSVNWWEQRPGGPFIP